MGGLRGNRGATRTEEGPAFDRAGGAERDLAHRRRDPLAAADPGAALPGVRRRARRPGGRRGRRGGTVLLRGAGDGLPLRELLAARDALEDRDRNLRQDRKSVV